MVPCKERKARYNIPLPRKLVSSLKGKAVNYVLDVGCGYGRACFFLNENRHSVIGVDIDRVQIKLALEEAKLRGIKGEIDFLVNDARNLCFPNSSFDAVIMLALFTLVSKSDRLEIIREIHKVLKPFGYIFIEEFGQTWENPIYSKRYKEDLTVTGELGTFTVKDETGKVLHLVHHFSCEELSALLRSFSIISFEEDVFTSYYHGNWVKGYIVIVQKR